MSTIELGTMSPGGNNAGDLISRGEQLLQIRTKSQLLVAVQRPRSIERFTAKLQAMSAQAGEDFYYSIPYKNHKKGCRDRYNCDCPSTPVEGAGVGLARAGAAEWGNCSVEVRIEAETETEWLIRADWIDFENNFSRSEVKRVSKMKPKQGGGYYRVSDKDLDVVYQVGASKVERDCILRALPRHIVEACFQTAKAAAMAEKAPIPQQVARLLQKFKEVEVTVEMIERLIRCPFTESGMRMADKSPSAVCAHLRGILTAIRGGEITVEEIFGTAAEHAAAGPTQSAGEQGTSTPSPAPGTAGDPAGRDPAGVEGAASPTPAVASVPTATDPMQNSTRSRLMGLAKALGCAGTAEVPQANGSTRTSTTIVLDESMAARIGMPGAEYVALIALTNTQGQALVADLEQRRAIEDAGAVTGGES